MAQPTQPHQIRTLDFGSAATGIVASTRIADSTMMRLRSLIQTAQRTATVITGQHLTAHRPIDRAICVLATWPA